LDALILSGGLDWTAPVSIPLASLILGAAMLYIATRNARPYSAAQMDAYQVMATQLNLANQEIEKQAKQIEELKTSVANCREENLEKEREMNRLWREIDDLRDKLGR